VPESSVRWRGAFADADLARVERALASLRPELNARGLALGLARADDPAAGTLAGPRELELAAAMPVPRRRDFLAGRLAIRRALAAARLPQPEVLRQGRRPLLPPGCAGSISHSGGLAVAVAGPRELVRALGCDLELRGLPVPSAHIVLDAAELARLHGAGGAERRLLAAFSAKEAAFKALSDLLPPDRAPAVLLDLGTSAVPGGLLAWPHRQPDRVLRVRVHPAGPGVFSWTGVFS
jgi:enterobactin synthetase component D